MLENYQFLAVYNKVINEKIYTACEKISDDYRKKDCGAFFESIHNSLNHLVLADKIWLNRFSKQNVNFSSLTEEILEIKGGFTSLNDVLFDDFEELKIHRFKMDLAIENWSKELTEEFLASTMHYNNIKGVKREHATWKALSHFFNHQTHHRGQVTTLLSQFNIDYGITDLIALVE